MSARTRHIAAFIAQPVDPFAEHHRLNREWEARFNRLSQDHAAYRQRLNDACQVRETSR